MWRILEFGGGLLLVLIVFADVFASVLVPRPAVRRARIGPVLSLALAPVWRGVTRRIRSPRRRQTVAGSLGPAILVLALAAWVTGLALGFAMMLHAEPQNLAVRDHGFGEALFQATLALSTLGVLDADVNGPARAVVAVAGIAGFSILTLTVAFLLQVQGALHRREMLVMTAEARMGCPPTADALLRTMKTMADDERAALFAAWEGWTADVMQSHLSYPVLLRFRSLDPRAEWLACLAAALDAAALVRAAEPAELPRTGRAAAFLAATAERALVEFAHALRLDGQVPAPARDLAIAPALIEAAGLDAVHPQRWEERFRALRARHAALAERLAARLDLALGDPLA
jgi:hypothetical protein